MYSMMIELNPSLVFAEVSIPPPALEVYKLMVSFGTQKKVQVSDNDAASNVDAANALILFDKPTDPSITLFFANLAAIVILLVPV